MINMQIVQFQQLFHLPRSDVWSDQYSLSRDWKLAISAWNWASIPAMLRILVGWQMWKREVHEMMKLHNLGIVHVSIQSELKNVTGDKHVGTGNWNRSPVPTRPKTNSCMSSPGYNPAPVTRSGYEAVADPDRVLQFGYNPDLSWVTQIHCQH